MSAAIERAITRDIFGLRGRGLPFRCMAFVLTTHLARRVAASRTLRFRTHVLHCVNRGAVALTVIAGPHISKQRGLSSEHSGQQDGHGLPKHARHCNAPGCNWTTASRPPAIAIRSESKPPTGLTLLDRCCSAPRRRTGPVADTIVAARSCRVARAALYPSSKQFRPPEYHQAAKQPAPRNPYRHLKWRDGIRIHKASTATIPQD